MSLSDSVPGGSTPPPPRKGLLATLAGTRLGRALPVGLGLAYLGKRENVVQNSLAGASVVDALADAWKTLRGGKPS